MQANSATYLHRIGRAGRFGAPGIALSIYDKEEDKVHFDTIIKHYKFEEKIQTITGGAEEIKEKLRALDSV